MKKMTLFTLFLSSILMLSCSNQEPLSQEELASVETSVSVETSANTAKTSAEEESGYLYGIEVYYSSTEIEVERLGTLKTKLVAELESGNKGVMEQIENIQKEIEKLNRFKESLIAIKKPKGPVGPMPPQPCFVDNKTKNCIPKLTITDKTAIVLGSDLVVSEVAISDEKNQIVETEFLPIEDSFGQASFQIKSDCKGEGTMYTTFKTKVVGTITIPTPIIKQ